VKRGAAATLVGAIAVALTVPGCRRAGARVQEPGAVRAVASLDLSRYAGRWYEIARFPNRFQRRCVAATTAEYELLRGGTVRVVNRCRLADGRMIRAEGKARLADGHGPASRLKVRFAPALLSFLPMVWADYWVLDVTDDYGAALVGTPDRRYLWVLARDSTLDQETYQRLIATAAGQGFDVTRLERSVPQ
jgi:apolipoprotein D and lipocalin family protein